MKMERTKITRKQFEAKVIEMFGLKNIHKSPFSENKIVNGNELKPIPMTLYYLTKGKIHIGTWCQGEGWIF